MPIVRRYARPLRPQVVVGASSTFHYLHLAVETQRPIVRLTPDIPQPRNAYRGASIRMNWATSKVCWHINFEAAYIIDKSQVVVRNITD